MRRSYKTNWLEEKGLIAVNLEANFCAEHEFGIEDLLRPFGIERKTEIFGIERRRIKIVPEQGLIRKDVTGKQPLHYFVFSRWLSEKFNAPSELYLSSDETLSSAWDGGTFGLVCNDADKKDLKNMDKIFKSFEKKDIAIWLGGGGSPFQGPGLTIGIVSEIPYHHLKTMEDADQDNFNLVKAAEETGIGAELAKAGKRFYALSPRWKDETKKEIIFWLNPMDQDKNNHGWFGIKELRQWINNNGPIPKNCK